MRRAANGLTMGVCVLAFALCSSAFAQEGFGSNVTIAVPAAGTVGVAAPYPSSITVTGLKRPVTHVGVQLFGYTHTCSQDVGALLVGPQGQTCLLFGRCGGCNPGPMNLFPVFDDTAMHAFPTDGSIPISDVYRPGSNCLLGNTSFAAPAPPAPYGTSFGVFNGTQGNGEWKLYVQDFFSGDSGSIRGWQIFITQDGSPAMGVGAGVQIPAGQPVATSGVGTPYPSTIHFSGLTGRIASVSVRINGLTHPFPADIDMLLVGPNEQACMLMSDAGGGHPGMTDTTLAFTDMAPGPMPQVTNPGSGTFRPTDYEPGDAMPPPAPAGPYATSLSVFRGTIPNGIWSLYIRDDTVGDFGTTGVWELTLFLEPACASDFNNSGRSDVQDIFDFLTAWFAGC